MQFTLFTLIGAALGWGLAALLGRGIGMSAPPLRPSALSWTALGLGAASALMVAAGLFLPTAAMAGPVAFAANTAVFSIALSVAAVFDAVWAIVHRDRRWVAWTALGLAAAPALFWVAFAVGNMLLPGA